MKLNNTAIQFLSNDKVKCLRIEAIKSKIFIYYRWGKGDNKEIIRAFSAEELMEVLKGAVK